MSGSILGRRGLVPMAVTAMMLGLCGVAKAQGVPVAKASGVFVFPRNFDLATACDGRFGFRGDPSFGDGLTASYAFRGSLTINPSHSPFAGNVPKEVSFAESSAGDGPRVVADDSFVIRTHDDLIARYHELCWGGYLADLRLIDIAYHRASARERRASPPAPPPTGDLAPVSLDRRDLGFLPEPVAHGTIAFDNWPALYSGTNWLPITPDFGTGLNAAFVFEGREDDDYLPHMIADLARDGFTAVTIDLEGKSATLILDQQPITTRPQMLARAEVMRKREFGDKLKLERIVYYAAARDGIDGLRLPEAIRAELRRQLRTTADAYRAEIIEIAHAMPDQWQLKDMIDREWHHLDGDPTSLGLDSVLASQGAIFGEIHDYTCKRAGEIFQCMLGLTYLDNGHPKYDQREIQLKRDPDNQYRLTYYYEDVILVG